MKKELHEFTIQCDSGSSYDTKVCMDGVPLQGLTRVVWEVRGDSTAKLTLEFTATASLSVFLDKADIQAGLTQNCMVDAILIGEPFF